MRLSEFKLLNNNFDIDLYMNFYNSIVEKLPDKTWLGTFKKETLQDLLSKNGKIWIWINNDDIVCSIMYIDATQESLQKLNVENGKPEEYGECGAVLVNEKYRGNKLQLQMLDFFTDYVKKINKKYIITTVHPDNIYSINNFKKNNYICIKSILLHRGKRNLYLKEI